MDLCCLAVLQILLIYAGEHPVTPHEASGGVIIPGLQKLLGILGPNYLLFPDVVLALTPGQPRDGTVSVSLNKLRPGRAES
jgi:hypothetical protein